MFRTLLTPRSIPIILALALLSGCFPSRLPQLQPPSGLQKLLQVADSTIQLRVDPQGFNEEVVGYQYLFLTLPVTRVYVPTLESDTRLQFSVAGGMRGYRFVEQAHSSARVLQLTIRDVGVHGYDLLILRKPSASVTLHATLMENGAVIRECEESYRASSTSHYAFSAELQDALSEALIQGSYKILNCLGLAGD